MHDLGEHIVYVAQPLLNANCIGHIRLRYQDAGGMTAMVASAARRILEIGRINREMVPL